MPSWTDRILYTTYTDSPDNPDKSAIKNLLYTSVPGYTTSDHVRTFLSPFSAHAHLLSPAQKPIVSLLLLPTPSLSSASTSTSSTPPVLRLPAHYTPTPDPRATLKRYTGRILDRVIGRVWWLLTLLGAGSVLVGMFNFVLGLGAWGWWSGGIKLGSGEGAGAV
jgi:hypothetical protein